MTEVLWLASCDPEALLLHLSKNWRQLGWSIPEGTRKLRLLACACCRHRKPSLGAWFDPLEKYADGLISLEDLRAEETTAFKTVPVSALEVAVPPYWPESLEFWAGEGTSLGQLGALLDRLRRHGTSDASEMDYQAAMIRDVVGNPFRPVTIDRACLAWNYGTVPKLAEAIYTDRAFDRLPILADALEDAGCTDPDILEHCRGPGPHVLGCWVVDLLLGRE